MKATIEFNDEQELRDAIDGWKWKNAMWQLDQKMRQTTKHGLIENVEANDDQVKNAEYWRNQLRYIISDSALDLES
jgi:hypothetical protein